MTRPLACRALLFDLDGVLADSTASVERHWRAWARRVGLDGDALVAKVHGRRAIDTIRAEAPALDAEAELAVLVAAEEDASDVVAAPGAAALLARLPADRWAVVTSGVRRVALARLRAVGIAEPPLLVAADEISRGKPDPEGYLTAARRLGVAPADCVVVEDAPAGVGAARAAGMRCVGLTSTHDPIAMAGVELLVASLAELEVGIGRDEGGVRLTLAAVVR